MGRMIFVVHNRTCFFIYSKTGFRGTQLLVDLQHVLVEIFLSLHDLEIYWTIFMQQAPAILINLALLYNFLLIFLDVCFGLLIASDFLQHNCVLVVVDYYRFARSIGLRDIQLQLL